jgi:RimJ/RimL family protein N-acetyltransferase
MPLNFSKLSEKDKQEIKNSSKPSLDFSKLTEKDKIDIIGKPITPFPTTGKTTTFMSNVEKSIPTDTKEKTNPLEITLQDNFYSTADKILTRWGIKKKLFPEEDQNKALAAREKQRLVVAELKEPKAVSTIIEDRLKVNNPDMFGDSDMIYPLDQAQQNYERVQKEFENAGFKLKVGQQEVVTTKKNPDGTPIKENISTFNLEKLPIDVKTFEENQRLFQDQYESQYKALENEKKLLWEEFNRLNEEPEINIDAINKISEEFIPALEKKQEKLKESKQDFDDLYISRKEDYTKAIPIEKKDIYKGLEDAQSFDDVSSIMQSNIKNLSVDVENYIKLTDNDLTKYHLRRGLELDENGNYKQRDTKLDQLDWGWARNYEQKQEFTLVGKNYEMPDLQKDSYIYTSINNEIAQNKSILESVEKEQLNFVDKIKNAKTQEEKDKYTSVIIELSKYKKLIKGLISRDEQYEQKNLSALKTEFANQQAFEDFEQKNLQTKVGRIAYTTLKEALALPGNVENMAKRIGALTSETEEKERSLLSLIDNKKLGVINKYANPKTTDHEGKIVSLKDAEGFHIPKDIFSFKDWSFNGEAMTYKTIIALRDMAILGGIGSLTEKALGRQAIKAFAATQSEKFFVAEALGAGEAILSKEGFRQAGNMGIAGLLTGTAEVAQISVRGASMIMPSVLLFGEDIYNGYIEQGFDPLQANKLTALQGSIEGVTEATFGNEIALYKSLIGEGLEEGAEKFSKELLEKALKEKFMKSTGKELSPKGMSFLMKLAVGSKKVINSGIVKSSMEGVKTTFEEVGEEEIGLILNTFLTNPLAKEYKPDYSPSEELDAQNVLSTAINTAATMLIPGARSAYSHHKSLPVQALSAKFMTAKSYDLSNQIILDLLKNGDIDQKEAERRLTLVTQYKKTYDIAKVLADRPITATYTKEQKNNYEKQLFKNFLTKNEYEQQLQFAVTDKERNNILKSIADTEDGINTLLESGLFSNDEERVNNVKMNLATYFNKNIINTYSRDVVKNNIEDLEFQREKETNKELYDNYTEAINNLKQYDPNKLKKDIEADLKAIDEENNKPESTEVETLVQTPILTVQEEDIIEIPKEEALNPIQDKINNLTIETLDTYGTIKEDILNSDLPGVDKIKQISALDEKEASLREERDNQEKQRQLEENQKPLDFGNQPINKTNFVKLKDSEIIYKVNKLNEDGSLNISTISKTPTTINLSDPTDIEQILTQEEAVAKFKESRAKKEEVGQKESPSVQVDNTIKAKKTDIERRIQEVENFVNQDFFAQSELLAKHWKTKKDLFENKVKQLRALLQKGIKTGKDLRTLTNLLNDIRGVLNEGLNISNSDNIKLNEKNIQELADSLFSMISDDVIKDYINEMNTVMETRFGKNAVSQQLVQYTTGEWTLDGKNVEYFLSKETLENAKNNKEINAKYDTELKALEQQPTSTTQSENPALRDVESTAKALETESKNKPTIWEQVKNAAKNIIEGIKNIGKSEYEKRRKLVDDIEFNDYPSDKEGEIILKKDGKNIGSMDLHYGADGLLHIKWVKINKDFQGKGLSLLLYGKATEIAAQKGLKGVGTGFVTHSTTKTQGIYKHFNLTELGESKGSMEEGVKGRKVILHSLKDGNENNSISEAYHAAKKDSSNPDLVKAVESLLSKEQPTSTTQETPIIEPTESSEEKIVNKTIEEKRKEILLTQKNFTPFGSANKPWSKEELEDPHVQTIITTLNKLSKEDTATLKEQGIYVTAQKNTIPKNLQMKEWQKLSDEVLQKGIIAVLTDKEGNYLYFTKEGNKTTNTKEGFIVYTTIPADFTKLSFLPNQEEIESLGMEDVYNTQVKQVKALRNNIDKNPTNKFTFEVKTITPSVEKSEGIEYYNSNKTSESYAIVQPNTGNAPVTIILPNKGNDTYTQILPNIKGTNLLETIKRGLDTTSFEGLPEGWDWWDKYTSIVENYIYTTNKENGKAKDNSPLSTENMRRFRENSLVKANGEMVTLPTEESTELDNFLKELRLNIRNKLLTGEVKIPMYLWSTEENKWVKSDLDYNGVLLNNIKFKPFKTDVRSSLIKFGDRIAKEEVTPIVETKQEEPTKEEIILADNQIFVSETTEPLKPKEKPITTPTFSKIDGPTLTDISKPLDRNKSLGNKKVSKEQEQKAKDWFNTYMKSSGVKFEDLSYMVNSTAFATWQNAIITLYNGSTSPDLYHESFHDFTQMYLTPKQKRNLYEEVMNTSEGKKAIKGITNKIDQYKAIEELLAEDFRKYMLSDQKLILNNRFQRNSIFRKIYNFLKSILTNQPSLEEIYKNLATNNISKYKRNIDNVMFGKLNRDVLGLSVSESYNLNKAIDSLLSGIFRDLNIPVSKFFKDPNTLQASYNTVYNQLVDSYEELNNDYNELLEQEDPNEEQLYYLDKNLNNLRFVLDKTNWNNIKLNHVQNSAFLKLSEAFQELGEEDFREEDIKSKESMLYDEDDTKSIKNKASAQLIYMVATLPKYINNKPTYNPYLSFVPNTEDFDIAWNKIAKVLTGTRDYQKQYEILNKESQKDLMFKDVKDSLLNPLDDLNILSAQFRNQFSIIFSQPLVPMFISNFRYDIKEGKLSVSAREATSNAEAKVKQDWIINLQSFKNKYAKLNKYGRRELNLDKVLETFKNIERASISKETKIEFLEALGITISPIAKDSEEFDKFLKDPNNLKKIYNFLEDYNALREGKFKDFKPTAQDIQRVNEPIYDIVQLLTKDVLINDKKAIINIDKSVIKKLINIELTKGDKYFSDNRMNSEGSSTWGIKQWSQQTVLLNTINDVESYPTYSDLLASPLGDIFNIQTNPDANNAYLRAAFNLETGERNTTNGKPVILDLFVQDGLNISLTEDSEPNGNKTMGLSRFMKAIQDISTLLSSGNKEHLRYGDKTTSNGTKTIFPRKDTSASQNFLPVDIRRFDNTLVPTDAWEIYKVRLATILQRTNDFFSQDKLKDNDSFSKNIINNKDYFGLFDGILTDETKKLLLANKLTSTEQIDAKSLVDEFEKEIKADIAKYNQKMTDDYIKNELESNTTLKPENYIDNYLLQEYSFETLIKAYVVNSYLLNMEHTALMFQDIRFYDNKKSTFKEPFKRFAKASSTGVLGVNDNQINKYLNKTNLELDTYNKKHNTSLTITDRQLPKKITILNDITLGNIESIKELIKDLEEIFKDAPLEERIAIAESYNGAKISDAMGIILMDYYRENRIKTGNDNWNEETELLYRKIVQEQPLTPEERKSAFLFFPPLKLRVTGFSRNSNGEIIPIDLKFALSPLLGTVVKGKGYEQVRDKMIKQNISIGAFASASKHSATINTTTGKYNDLYQEEDYLTDEVPQDFIYEVVSSPNKLKEEVSFSTQLRKLLFVNSYNQGIPTDYTGKKDWDSLTEKEKLANSRLYNLDTTFTNTIEDLVTLEKNKLLTQLGATLSEDKTKYTIDQSKLSTLLDKELRARDLPQSALESIKLVNQQFKYKLDSSLQRETLEQIILSIVDNKLRKQKGLGEALIQASSVGYNTPTLERVDTWNNTGGTDLPYYQNEGRTLPDGTKVTSAQKVKIALQGDFKKLLLLPEVNNSLETLNALLKNEDFVNKYRDLITLTGVRIPVQGHNSMEFMEVYEFLPEEAGPVIIVSPALVAKSGGDFDWDKITTLYHSFDVDDRGNVVEYKSPSEQQTKNLFKSLAKEFGLSLKQEVEDGLSTDLTSKMFNLPQEELDAIILEESQKEKFSNFIAKRYYNNVLNKTIREVLERKENIQQLITPNSTHIFEPTADSRKESLQNSKPSWSDIPNPIESLNQHESNGVGKKGLGILAVANTFFAQLQKTGAYLSKTYKKGSKSRPLNHRLQHNRTKEGNVSVSNILDANKEYKISEIISQLMNGAVDVAKKDWLFYINGVLEVVPTFAYLTFTGTPPMESVAFLNQPILYDYTKTLRNYKSPIMKVLNPSKYNNAKIWATYDTMKKYLEFKNANQKLTKSKKILNNTDVERFQLYLNKSNNVLPKEFFTENSTFSEFYNNTLGKKGKAPQNTKWILDLNTQLYNLIDLESGEVYIENVNLLTGERFYNELQQENQILSSNTLTKNILIKLEQAINSIVTLQKQPFEFYKLIYEVLPELANENINLFAFDYMKDFSIPNKDTGKIKTPSTVEEKLAQIYYLTQFIEFDNQQSTLSSIRTTFNQDTNKSKNIQSSKENLVKRSKLEQYEILPKEIIKKLEEESTTRAFIHPKRGVDKFLDMLTKEIFEITNHPVFNRFLFEEFNKPTEQNNIPFNRRMEIQEDWVKSVKNDFIEYLVKNNLYLPEDPSKKVINYFYSNLISFENGLYKTLTSIKDEYPELVESNNLLQNLVSDPSREKVNGLPKYMSLRLKSSRVEATQVDAMVEDFRNLLDFSDPSYTPEEQIMIQKFAKDLAYLAYFQSGLNQSDISITRILPPEVLQGKISEIITKFQDILDNKPTEANYELNNFYKLFKKFNSKYFQVDTLEDQEGYSAKFVGSTPITSRDESKRGKNYNSSTSLDLLSQREKSEMLKRERFLEEVKSKTIIAEEPFTETTAVDNPKNLYIFEANQNNDNVYGSMKIKDGKKNRPNTLPITTHSSFREELKDSNLLKNKALLDSQIDQIIAYIKQNNPKQIIFSQDFAKRLQDTPDTYNYFSQKLQDNFGFSLEMPIFEEEIKDNIITEQTPLFSTELSPEEQETIINNYSLKYNISREESIKSIEEGISLDKESFLEKLKQCYL